MRLASGTHHRITPGWMPLKAERQAKPALITSLHSNGDGRRDRRQGFLTRFLHPPPSCPRALVAQWIEHRFPKPGVAGSIPAGGTQRL